MRDALHAAIDLRFAGDRVEGEVRTADGPARPLAGVLELLSIVEDLRSQRRPPAGAPAAVDGGAVG